MLPITLKQLESFVAVAEEKNFLRAADRLHRSQSAISSQIQALEQLLGVPLFHRTTRSVRLTEGGNRLLDSTQGILTRLETVVAEFRAEEAIQRGRLVIACTPSCASSLLPAALRQFQSQYPEITVEVKEAYATGVGEFLRREEADIAIGPHDPDSSDFAFRKLKDDPYGVIMSADYHLAGKTEVTFREIAGEPLIVMPRTSAVYKTLAGLYAAAGLVMQPKFEVVHHQTLYGLVAAGLGITVMPPITLPTNRDMQLHMADLVEPRVSRALGLVSLKANAASPAVKAFEAIATRAIPDS